MDAVFQKIISLGADYAAMFKTGLAKSKKRLNTMRGK